MPRRFDPPFPVENPTVPYWQIRPHPTISNYLSETFVTDVDTVVIGSGISGTLIAHNLLKRDHGKDKKSLVMLEARSIASGATGRNGGHIKPDCYRGFSAYSKLHGSGVARQQCELERANLEDFTAFIKDQGLSDVAELVNYRFADCYMTAATWEVGFASYRGFSEAGGDIERFEVLNADEAREKLRVECAGAITCPASNLWPYKLVIALIERCLQAGLLLYSNTPALEIVPSSTRRWKVMTTKGEIHCDRIVHATNGYATYLVPELSDNLIPRKGTVVAIDPSPNYSQYPLTHSYAIISGQVYDYLVQRPTDGKPLIYGGGDAGHPDGLLNGIGVYDDSEVSQAVADTLSARIPQTFIGWDSQSANRCAWTGIMGFTADELPLVGELPSKPGQFIAAGYNGHGMARAFLTTRALCQFMYGEVVDPRIPPVYFDIKGRLQRSLPHWVEMINEAKSLDAKSQVSRSNEMESYSVQSSL